MRLVSVSINLPSLCFLTWNSQYGYHGDVLSGWDPKIMTAAISQCTYKDGTPEFCPPFNVQVTSQSSAPYAPLCRKTHTVNEIVANQVLPKLPGCNAVTKGSLLVTKSDDTDFRNRTCNCGPASQLLANSSYLSKASSLLWTRSTSWRKGGCKCGNCLALVPKVWLPRLLFQLSKVSHCAPVKDCIQQSQITSFDHEAVGLWRNDHSKMLDSLREQTSDIL